MTKIIGLRRIIRNQARCNQCKDIIESEDRHDFKWCSCGNLAVDGGHDYLRRVMSAGASLDEFDELSEYEEAV